MFWHIFHLFFHPQKCMFQFKKSILFSVNAEPLFRLQVLKMSKIQKEYSKGKSVIKAKKLYFVLIHSLKFFSCHLHVGICFTFYFLIHLVLSGETAVYFTPFRGRAVISCFDLSLRFSTPASVCWHSHSLQDLQKKDDFISPLVKALLGEAQHCLCSKPSFPSLPPSLPLVLLKHSKAAKKTSIPLPDQPWLWSCWEHEHGKLGSGCAFLWGVRKSSQEFRCTFNFPEHTMCVVQIPAGFPNVWIPAGELFPGPDNTEWSGLEKDLKDHPGPTLLPGAGLENRKSHVCNPFAAPFFFTCNSGAQLKPFGLFIWVSIFPRISGIWSITHPAQGSCEQVLQPKMC